MLLQTFPYCRGHMVPQELWRFHQRRKEYPDSCPLPKKYDYFCYLKLTAFSLSRSGVEAISLPDPTQNYDNVEAVVTGWGSFSDNGRHPDILQKVRLRTMSNEQCQKRMIAYHDKFMIKDHMICTFEPGKGICPGDSGGPLVVRNQNGKYTLIGIASFIISGCATGNPDVYTRVSLFNEWIENNKCP